MTKEKENRRNRTRDRPARTGNDKVKPDASIVRKVGESSRNEVRADPLAKWTKTTKALDKKEKLALPGAKAANIAKKRLASIESDAPEEAAATQVKSDAEDAAAASVDVAKSVVRRHKVVKAKHAVSRLKKEVAREVEKSRGGILSQESGRRRVTSVRAVRDGRMERQNIRSVNPAGQKPRNIITPQGSAERRLVTSPKGTGSNRYVALRPRTNASAAVAHAKNKAAKAAAGKSRRAAAMVMKKITRGAAKVVVWIVRAVAHGLAMLAKVLIPALIAGAPVVLILLLVAILAIVVLSPFGIFFSGNEDNSNKVPELISAVEAEWNGELAALRTGLESQNYTVSVYYGDPDHEDDSDRVNNWKDVISLYSVGSSDGEVSKIVLKDEDAKAIRDLYFAMNTMSVNYWTETTESEAANVVEKERWVYNSKTGKFEKEVYTETEVGAETTTIEHADIWVHNKRYPEMLDAYPLAQKRQHMILSLMSYENEGLWNMLGIKTLEDSVFITDPSVIIRDLPPGTLGSALVEEATKYLGMPYMLGGNGDGVVDCSGLVVAVYGRFGIYFGDRTAATQAKWCVDNGKIIDASAVQAGDLVFYSSGSARVSDRFMNIGHVGIAVGDGTMIDASSSNGCVVHRAIYGDPVLYARPSV